VQEQFITVDRGTQFVGEAELAAETVGFGVVEGKPSASSLARYMATSAQFIGAWLSAAVVEASAMPMLAPIDALIASIRNGSSSLALSWTAAELPRQLRPPPGWRQIRLRPHGPADQSSAVTVRVGR